MRRRRHVWPPLVAVCLLFSIATTAHAECAWVLWSEQKEGGWSSWWHGTRWTPDSAYASKQDCDNAHVIHFDRGKDGQLVKREDPLAGKRGLGTNWRCLPDTVDPRGPKAGAR